MRQGQRYLRAELPRILATPPDVLSPRIIRNIEDLAGDWRRLDERVESLSNEIEAIARQDAGCERLMSVPGIGPIISSAMVAAIGAGDVFTKGRDFAAWLGLVPKQISTGDRTHYPRQDIQAWQSLPAGSIRASGMGRACEGEARQVRLWAQAMDRGGQEAAASQRAGDRAGQQSSPASPGAFWLAAGPSRRGRWIRLRTNPLDSYSTPTATEGRDEEPAMT